MGLERGDIRTFGKEATVTIKVGDNHKITAGDIIQCVEKTYGIGSVFACIPRAADGYEMTVSTKTVAEKLSQGVRFQDRVFDCNLLVSDTVVVSFLHLPAYILDQEIEEKLQQLGIKILSPVERRYYKGSNVADGTRIVKVKFPKQIVSLSYLMKFNTAYGPQLFRVIHNDQTKVCALCYSQSHLMAECDQFVCFRCEGQGHVKRQCTAARCDNCNMFPKRCECSDNYEENDSDNDDDDDDDEEYEEYEDIEVDQNVEETNLFDLSKKENKESQGDLPTKKDQNKKSSDGSRDSLPQTKKGENTEKILDDKIKEKINENQITSKTNDQIPTAKLPAESPSNATACPSRTSTQEVRKKQQSRDEIDNAKSDSVTVCNKTLKAENVTLSFSELRPKRKSEVKTNDVKRRAKVIQKPNLPMGSDRQKQNDK